MYTQKLIKVIHLSPESLLWGRLGMGHAHSGGRFGHTESYNYILQHCHNFHRIK